MGGRIAAAACGGTVEALCAGGAVAFFQQTAQRPRLASIHGVTPPAPTPPASTNTLPAADPLSIPLAAGQYAAAAPALRGSDAAASPPPA